MAGKVCVQYSQIRSDIQYSIRDRDAILDKVHENFYYLKSLYEIMPKWGRIPSIIV
jgi:hypothetical protein